MLWEIQACKTWKCHEINHEGSTDLSGLKIIQNLPDMYETKVFSCKKGGGKDYCFSIPWVQVSIWATTVSKKKTILNNVWTDGTQ